MPQNKDRQEKYYALRHAGFKSVAANRYKDWSWKAVNEIIKNKPIYDQEYQSMFDQHKRKRRG